MGFGGGTGGGVSYWVGVLQERSLTKKGAKNPGIHGSHREGEGSAGSKKKSRNRKERIWHKSGVLETKGGFRGKDDLGSDGR